MTDKNLEARLDSLAATVDALAISANVPSAPPSTDAMPFIDDLQKSVADLQRAFKSVKNDVSSSLSAKFDRDINAIYKKLPASVVDAVMMLGDDLTSDLQKALNKRDGDIRNATQVSQKMVDSLVVSADVSASYIESFCSQQLKGAK